MLEIINTYTYNMEMNHPQIPMDWYVTFLTVARAQSISRAADILCITQPAVSQCIRNLESHIELQLFIRNPRGVSLTPEGQLLEKQVAKGIYAIRHAEHLARNLTDLSAGTLHIGSSDTLTARILPPVLAKFKNAYPGIHIHITNQTSKDILKGIKERKIDIGVISMAEPCDTVISTKIVGNYSPCFFYCKNRQISAPVPCLPEDLMKQDLISLDSNTTIRKLSDTYLTGASNTDLPNYCFELGSLHSVSAFVRAGFGIGIGIAEFLDPDLTVLEIEPGLPKIDIALAMRKDMMLPPVVSAFIELFPGNTPETLK